MERAGIGNRLLERILSAPRPVVALLGRCASGKTAAATAFYRHFLDDRGRARCLFIVPNAPTVAAIRRQLLSDSPAGLIVAPQVMSFASLAGRVLASAGEPAHLLPAFQRRLLLRRIVDDLHRAGKLSALGSVADTPGLIVALDRAIAELKRAAVEPEALAKAVARGPGRAIDLVDVYRLYQEHLLASRTYDVEGRMWQARDYLAASAGAPAEAVGMDGVEAVATDGFTDFTPTQLRILGLLSRRLKRVLITLPLAPDGRDRMWHWTQRTLGNVRAEFQDRLEEIDLNEGRAAHPPDSPAQASLSDLCDRLFDMDAPKCGLPDGVGIIVASGTDAEVAAVARGVKRLLLGGSPPGSIAVLARSMESYRPVIERVFAEHEIPLVPASEPLTDVPIVRFVLDVASLGPKFAFNDVLRVVKNSYFRPSALGEFTDADVAAAEMIVREGNVLEGRSAYVEAANRLAARGAAGGEDDETLPLGPIAATSQGIRHASALLERLFGLSQNALEPSSGGPSEDQGPRVSIRGLLSIIDGLDLRSCSASHDDPALVARDLRALVAMEDALRQLDERPPQSSRGRALPACGAQAGAVPPQAAVIPLSHLREALAAVTCPGPRGESVVDVLDVLDARALRYEHAFLLGIGEGVFPRRFAEGSLIGEADRLAWARRGLVLDSRRDLAAREMLLFYLAVSRANGTLTLSYLDSDASGKPGAPSSFLLSLLEPAGGIRQAERAARVERIPPGRFLPPADQLASRRDAVNAAIAGLFEEDSEPFAPALAWAATNAPREIARAAAGLWARSRRWRRAPCDSFDGRIGDPDLLDRLSRRYPHEVVFSATMLNSFGQCPWQYFATYVLKLAPLARPERRLEAVSRGLFCHDVLFEAFTRLRGERGQGVRLAEIEESRLLAAIEQAVAVVAEPVEARRPPYPVLWRIQRDQMHREIRDYLFAQRARSGLPSEATHFELGFGVSQLAGLDPASRAEPIVLPTDAGEIRIRGKIDRVDLVRLEGAEGLFVIDYKTGRLPRRSEIEDGTNLQLPIYVEAAEQALDGASLGGAFHQIGAEGSTLFAAVKKARDGRYETVDGFTERRRAAVQTVGRFVAAMREGRFDLVPAHKCPGYCPFRQVCQYAEARAEFKTPARGREEELA